MPLDRSGSPRPRTVRTRVVYRNKWMTVREDEIVRTGPDGEDRPGIYAVVEKPLAAVVVPWDGTHVHLIGQYRYPLGAWSWELPQGAVEADGVDPETIARTELREETGFLAGRILPLGEMAFAPGMADQRFTAWLATDLTPGPAAPEPEEEGLLVPGTVTPDELDAAIEAGEIVDAATIAVWFRARGRLEPTA